MLADDFWWECRGFSDDFFRAPVLFFNRAGKDATRQPNLLGFETEDVMYLAGPVTWLDLLQPLLVLAGIGAPLFAMFALWQGRGALLEQRT